MITLSRCSRLETLWYQMVRHNRVPIEVKNIDGQILSTNKVEVNVDYYDHRINEFDLKLRVREYNQTIALVEPLFKEISFLSQELRFLVTDDHGTVIASPDEDIIGYCCPAADLIRENPQMKSLLKMGSPLEVHYDNGIHSYLIPILDDRGNIKCYLGVSSEHRQLSPNDFSFLYLMAQLLQERYRYTTLVEEYVKPILNTLGGSAVLLDENQRIMEVNSSFLNLLAVDSSEIFKGIPFCQFCSEIDIDSRFNYLTSKQNLNSFVIHFGNEDISCRLLFNTNITTPYGDHRLIIFERISETSHPVFSFLLPGKIDPFAALIGNSPAIKKIKAEAMRAASFDSTVLIEGESGTGKELLARAIHQQSQRPGKFVAINCGAIPAQLIQSELFGYEEGAFTGARKRGQPGKLEIADRGTIFLDEIGEMPLDLQVNLLRFLQDKTFLRVGGIAPKTVNVRVISATNRKLRDEVANGRFREDLYYRLNVINIEMPPLRDRKEDIPLLANYFLEKLAAKYNIPKPRISSDDIKTLQSYDWPGNIRELENIIERALVLCEGDELCFRDLLPVGKGKKNSIAQLKAHIERENIESHLALYKGNISQTARALGITRQTLYRKIKLLQIDRSCYHV